MQKYLCLLLIFCAYPLISQSQDKKALNILAIGAHPDDCDSKFGGTAIKFAQLGHNVKFVSLCNGNKGHYKIGPTELAEIRKGESMEAARRFGIAEYEVLHYSDCELLPDLEARRAVITQIREWEADIVISHRPNDYMSDHRYTGELVQDAAYNVIVPHELPLVPALKHNPVFLYFQDRFKKPAPFSPDIVVDISDVVEKKIYAMSAHESQYFDWLPWTNGELDEVPEGEEQRQSWLLKKRGNSPGFNVDGGSGNPKYREEFEICEYGKQPSAEELQQLFPMASR